MMLMELGLLGRKLKINMFIAYKNRELNPNKPVEIYRNLNKPGKTYSIRQDGLIIGHSNSLLLKDCEFIVNEVGRQRVIKQKRKNVHAFIRGELLNCNPEHLDYGEVTYNPYKNKSFLLNGKKVKFSKIVLISGGHILGAKGS